MKKIVLAIFVAFTVTVFAQEKPKISSAIIAFNKNDYVEAKKYIDEAAEIINQKGAAGVDAKQLSKFYYYKGIIDYRLATNPDPELNKLAPQGIESAAENYVKLLEHEKAVGKERYTQDVLSQVPFVTSELKNKGFNANDAKDFETAANYFTMAYNLQKNPAFGDRASVDTTIYYYTALSYSSAEQYEKSIPILKDVLTMGYNGYTYTATSVANDQPMRFANKDQMNQQVEIGVAKDPKVGDSERPNVYKSLLSAFIESGDSASFQEYLMKARAEFPDDEALIRLELQGYLDSKEYEKALSVLNLAIEKDPNNTVYYYVKGFILQTEVEDNEGALAAYGKAVEIDPENFDCWFMSGVVWYDQGKAALDQMNQLGMSKADQKKYDELKTVKNEKFEKSLPFFEKAHELNAEDLETVKALWEVYRQLRNPEKTMEFKEKMDALGG
jgi:tetratricopeptide (TPR) repeat protein